MKRLLPFFLLLLPSPATLACATCLCGDPTLTTMGTEKPFAGRLRGGVEFLSRGETLGQPGVSEHIIDEQRLTFNVSYALNESWVFAASLPLVDKQVRRFDLSREQAQGLGDMDLTAKWFIGHDERFPRRQLWGLQFGLRVPTSTEQKARGVAIDFDAQPGAGAVIPSIGSWYGRYQLPWFLYLSGNYQHAVSKGYQGYEAGDAILMTGLLQYAFIPEFAALFSLDGRWKAQDQYNGADDPDSGGLLVMATPGLVWTPLTDLIVNLSVQLPAIESLKGRQEEDITPRIGVTYDF